MDQNMLAQMLMQQGGSVPQAGGAASGAMGGAADMMRKIMMIRALQNQGQQPPQQPMGPGGFPLPPGQPLPQQMNANPVGGINA